MILIFWGLGDIIMHIDTAFFVATVVPIGVCAFLYLYRVFTPIWNPNRPIGPHFQISFGISSEKTAPRSSL
jgi:hypothetical protein